MGQIETPADRRRRELAHLVAAADVDAIELRTLVGLEVLLRERPHKHVAERQTQVVETRPVVAHRRLLDAVAVALLPVGEQLAEGPRIR
jgi:hypothetical protein